MTATIREFKTSPSANADFDNSSVEVSYKILRTLDESEAMSLLMATAPTSQTMDGVTLSHRVFKLDHDGHDIWTGTCSYKKRSKEKPELQADESEYQFETGGGTSHITHSIATIQSVRAGGGTATDFKNAIGWNRSEITGCDIISPVYNFSEIHVIPAADVDAAYKLALFRATGKVNNASFKGFSAGEVLFLGAAGSVRGNEDWQITYRFAASENVTGLSVGGITGINKKGWEYLWLYFEDDVSENVLIQKPLQANVEQVYKTADFSTIGIGT